MNEELYLVYHSVNDWQAALPFFLTQAALFIIYQYCFRLAFLRQPLLFLPAIFMVKNSLTDALSRNFRDDVYSIMLLS